MEANERQIGGQHYKAKFQHWDLVAYNGMGYFEAVITKYTTRWKKKNGSEDIEKAIHYQQKLLELYEAGVIDVPSVREPVKFDEFLKENPLSSIEQSIFLILLTWRFRSDLVTVGTLLNELLRLSKESCLAD